MSHVAPDIQSGRAKQTTWRGRIVLTLFALGAFAILIALGLWQLQRRDWKNDLITRFEQALSKPPIPYEPPRTNANERSREFTRVKASGTFEEAKTVKILVPAPEEARAQTQDGFGYLLFTPLKLGDGAVFVNRGFAPRSVADRGDIKGGEATVTGILRLSEKPGWFLPAPDPAKRLFFSADIPEMIQAAGVGPGTVVSEYIEAEPSPQASEWPKARDPHELLAAIPNRHLEYALTWFGLAGALAGVYGFFIASTARGKFAPR
jgi:surfeit locus 1 family protein